MKSYWPNRLLRLALMPLLLLPLAGCLTTTPTGATSRELILDFYCGKPGQPGAYERTDPVPLSHHDTPGTIDAGKRTNAQIDGNNAVYDKLCPPTANPKAST